MTTSLILVVLVRTLTDVCFKKAVHFLNFDSISSVGKNLKSLVSNVYLWLGILFGGLNVVLWMFSLSQVDLSYAYPFLSLSYILIIFAGKYLFHEHFGWNKIVGIGFIMAGAVFLFVD